MYLEANYHNNVELVLREHVKLNQTGGNQMTNYSLNQISLDRMSLLMDRPISQRSK